MALNNIILITNNEQFAKIIKPKLVLLRDIDNIIVSDYTSALSDINNNYPTLILIHCSQEKEECIELIKQIKNLEKANEPSSLLIVDEYDQDFVLNAFDEGINDFILLEADNAEFLMRIIWGIKKYSLSNKIKKQKALLEDVNIIDTKLGVYSNKYCNNVVENELNFIKESNQDSILMLISASEECKTRLTPLKLAKTIKKSIRESDVVIQGEANRFYLLLSKVKLSGACCVWEKIKKNIGKNYTLKAGATIVGNKDFETMKTELTNTLVEAGSVKEDLVIVNEEESLLSEDWIETISSPKKNFKLFKHAFNKKLNKVIAPVFFQLQQLYEEKLFEVQIEQNSTQTESKFLLRKDENISELTITYPGYSKINIDIVHQGLDSPENRRISLDLSDISEKKLTEIIEEFINEFKTSMESKGDLYV